MIELTDLAVTTPAGTPLLPPISLHARPGTITALTGPSGSGKSTLLHALLGRIPATALTTGTARVGNHHPLTLNPLALRTFRRRHITYTGQDPAAALNPTMRVRALLTEYATLEHAEQALAAVELPTTYLRRRTHELSGGEQRRLALARALARRTPVLLLDEPFAGLHSRLQNSIAEVLRIHITTHGTTLVVSGHHHDILTDLADDTVALRPDHLSTDTRPPHPRKRPARHVLTASAATPADGTQPAKRSESPGGTANSLAAVRNPTALGATTGLTIGGDGPAVRGKSAETVLSVAGLRVVRGRRAVLEGIDCVVGPGEAVAVAGPSGAGKSTLARAVVGLQEIAAGKVHIEGRVGFVPQDSSGSLNPRRTVAQALRRAGDMAGLLGRVELSPELARRYPHELSGGQRQRVALARALATDPALLVCDEITSALDGATAEAIMGLLDRLRREQGLGLLVVSHDMPLVTRYCTEMHVLESGRIVESGAVTKLLGDPQHEATLALIG
ncbi:ATP-binding cassette domain-containing protein [Nocardia sp. NPDC051030]|uniref:ABC transporter ATP-binding protein n=1 Tax=Nocardia sp. NPDC051030 TaxID=3155162 RepID=UPI0034258415